MFLTSLKIPEGKTCSGKMLKRSSLCYFEAMALNSLLPSTNYLMSDDVKEDVFGPMKIV